MSYLNIVWMLVALAVVVISSQGIIKSLGKIAHFLKISDFAAAFIIMAFSTSLPELFVGINSALEGNPSLSLGNVIGSNLVNLTLIAGIGITIVRGIKLESEKVKKNSLMMFFIVLLPLILMVIGKQISRIDGIILIAVFIFYSISLLKSQKEYSKVSNGSVKKYQVITAPMIFIISLIILFVASRFAIHYAILSAEFLNLAPIVIGLILLALGTSLPELSFTVSSFMDRNSDLSLGNLIGSSIANSTLVLGVTALIMPITADFLVFMVSSAFMILGAFLFATFVESGSKLYLKEGISLILVYIVFMVIQIYLPSL